MSPQTELLKKKKKKPSTSHPIAQPVPCPLSYRGGCKILFLTRPFLFWSVKAIGGTYSLALYFIYFTRMLLCGLGINIDNLKYARGSPNPNPNTQHELSVFNY